MGCNCNKRAAAKTGPDGKAAPGPNTYRIIVGGRQVYESSNKTAADTVAGRFDNPVVLKPGEIA